MPLNLSYIPLETDGIQEILYVIYSGTNPSSIPLFLEEMNNGLAPPNLALRTVKDDHNMLLVDLMPRKLISSLPRSRSWRPLSINLGHEG